MCFSATSCGSGNHRYDGVCDKDGCDLNSCRMGNESLYGKGDIIDTSEKKTVVTKFITVDGTDSGRLSAIERVYVQDVRVIQNSKTDINGVDTTNKITDGYCKQQKAAFGDTDFFEALGGLSTMSDSFDRGMVLVMSICVDYAAEMRWLDALRGICAAKSDVPANLKAESPGSSVSFSNIKFGALGPTY